MYCIDCLFIQPVTVNNVCMLFITFTFLFPKLKQKQAETRKNDHLAVILCASTRHIKQTVKLQWWVNKKGWMVFVTV